jgi:antibiotic biosynthesis monooxygenase (ABM) superfamily enzyme
MDIIVKPERPSRRHRIARSGVTTLVAWIAAYAIVNAVTAAGGEVLAAASAPVRMLVVSGVLVVVMVNGLMPVLAGLVARLFGARS